ncbi:MAG: phosphonopyruvate decarboxylase [Marinifilaceae bacterium]
MIELKSFFENLDSKGVNFYTGVPDSLLKSISAYLFDNYPGEKHIIASNEGASVGLASGYYLGTGQVPIVYMQNSGIGNAVNPLLSLADQDVYSIPMILFVGWRGEPGVKDEPQHVKQGKVSKDLFDAMQIPCEIMSADTVEANSQVNRALVECQKNSSPYVFLIKKGTFEDYSLTSQDAVNTYPEREDAIEKVVDHIEKESVVVSTTGKISRELFEIREKHHTGHDKDFLTVGSMGHASQIAMGVAMSCPQKNVYCFDGDGAIIMHTGSFGIIAAADCTNLKHIVFNNGAHDSVGGQPTIGFDIDFGQIAKGFGYKRSFIAESMEGLNAVLPEFIESEGPSLLEVRVKKGARKDLGRPTTTPIENKENLMEFLKK